MKKILHKLSSRKLWVAIIGIVAGVATAFGITENEYATIAGAVVSAISAASYILGEASIDKANKQ